MRSSSWTMKAWQTSAKSKHALSPTESSTFLPPQILTSRHFRKSRNPFRRQRIRRMKVAAAFLHETLSLEILHQRINRLVRHAHRARHVSDTQFSGIKNSRQHFADAVGFDRQARRLCATGGWDTLWVLQAGLGYSIYAVSPQSIGRFNQSADKQPLKYLLNLAVGHPGCNPYLGGIGGIVTRDHRQYTLLVARQRGCFVVCAHHHKEGILRVCEAHVSARMQLDQELMNALTRHP